MGRDEQAEGTAPGISRGIPPCRRCGKGKVKRWQLLGDEFIPGTLGSNWKLRASNTCAGILPCPQSLLCHQHPDKAGLSVRCGHGWLGPDTRIAAPRGRSFFFPLAALKIKNKKQRNRPPPQALLQQRGDASVAGCGWQSFRSV